MTVSPLRCLALAGIAVVVVGMWACVAYTIADFVV